MPWYDEFFDEEYFKTYTNLNWERTVRDVDFIIKALDLSFEDQILDIPCGFGRHSIELTKRGYKVTGMDFNEPQIKEAKRLMKEMEITFEIIQADMRKIPHENCYDKLMNYFTSFGYFSDEENEETLESFRKALKPGGLLLIEMVNRDGLLKNFQAKDVERLSEKEFLLAERKYDLKTGRMHTTHTYINSEGKISDRIFDHRLYCPHELIQMFNRHGFEVVNLFGDRGGELTNFSWRIAIVGKKIS